MISTTTPLVWQLPQSVQLNLDRARLEGKKIVLATGVFDILHAEHRKFLQKAKTQGDFLLVGLESDQRVKELKGSSRPINPAIIRQTNLEKWQLADGVFILPSQFSLGSDHESLINLIKPAVLAVSSHTDFLVQKATILQKYGGRVIVVHEHNPAFSTTQLLKVQI